MLPMILKNQFWTPYPAGAEKAGTVGSNLKLTSFQ
jgi:hypothetical protein